MPYITISNANKIIRKLDEQKFSEISEKLYKWDIYFFSKRETAHLNAIRELLKDPQNFIVEYYHPIKVADSYKYLYPESQPAYHKDNTCERLNSNFRNVEVPLGIQEKGVNEVLKFREWYKNTSFKEDDPKDYVYKLQIKFPYVGEIKPSSIEYSNSGWEKKSNYSLKELEQQIDDLLLASGSYFKEHPNLQPLIRRYQKWTFLAYVYGEIQNNDSGLNNDELKDFLRNYEESFKKPVKQLLQEYYRVKFNPEMTFEGSILQELGFKICNNCLVQNALANSPILSKTAISN